MHVRTIYTGIDGRYTETIATTTDTFIYLQVQYILCASAQDVNIMTTQEFNKIDASQYTGLAKARIDSYNRNVKDYEREIRKGRGNDAYSDNLVKNDIPHSQKAAVKEMVAQDSRNGRLTKQSNMGGDKI